MKEIQFRFKVIKILGKIGIDFRLPLKMRFKFSRWITNIVSLFIKFDPPVPIKFEKIIKVENQEDLDMEY